MHIASERRGGGCVMRLLASCVPIGLVAHIGRFRFGGSAIRAIQRRSVRRGRGADKLACVLCFERRVPVQHHRIESEKIREKENEAFIERGIRRGVTTHRSSELHLPSCALLQHPQSSCRENTHCAGAERRAAAQAAGSGGARGESAVVCMPTARESKYEGLRGKRSQERENAAGRRGAQRMLMQRLSVVGSAFKTVSRRVVTRHSRATPSYSIDWESPDKGRKMRAWVSALRKSWGALKRRTPASGFE